MPDYIYLLENRLSPAQYSALRLVRDVARSKALTVFLVGGAVRDLTSGSPVRDLDVVVQGNALKLKKDIEKAGGVITGEFDPGQALFARFPGNVRIEVGSTLNVAFPKPGKPSVRPGSILEDLRRRDFTANAMALSLNEGSYGLLMDPLNGVADIENRELRLVGNYGFIEDPVRMIRAARLMARLGWTLEDKTQARYETGQAEGYISAMSEYQRGYETEEIVHEEDPVRVLKGLEADGWMNHLAPYWTSAKVNEAELHKMRETLAQLQMQGIHPATAAVQFPLLTARLAPKELAALKASFPRPGFVAEIDALEGEAKEFAALLGSKGAALPSQAWRAIVSAKPETVLAVAYSTKSPALQAKFKSFFSDWPQARQKIPYTLLQEMRIVPDIPGYDELLEKLFFELMDGNLSTSEQLKAFLEPYSPPAPPPPVSTRKARAGKKDAKPSKARARKAAKAEALAEADALGAAGEDDAAEDADDLADPEDLEVGDLEVGDLEVPDLEVGDLEIEDIEIEDLDVDEFSDEDADPGMALPPAAPPAIEKKAAESPARKAAEAAAAIAPVKASPKVGTAKAVPAKAAPVAKKSSATKVVAKTAIEPVKGKATPARRAEKSAEKSAGKS